MRYNRWVDRKSELLEKMLAFALEQGISDASLRPLAAALGTNARMLIYHFGSKEEMVVELLDRARAAQEELLRSAVIELPADNLEEKLSRLWHAMSSKRNEAYARLFFEAYGLGVQGRPEYSVALKSSVTYLGGLIEQMVVESGRARAEAKLMSSVLAATFRGLLLDLLVANDRNRVNATAFHVIEQTLRNK